MKNVPKYPGYENSEKSYEVRRIVQSNISALNRSIDHFLSEKKADPKQWAELIRNTELIIAQSMHIYQLPMESSTHTGTLIPQYKMLGQDVSLPIDENTLLRIAKGSKMNEEYTENYDEFVPSFEGKITVEDPQEKALPVSYSDNLSVESAIMAMATGLAGGKQADPVAFEIGGIKLDAEKNMLETVLVLKRIVQAFAKFEQGIKNRDKQAEAANTTVDKMAQTQAEKMKKLAERLGIK